MNLSSSSISDTLKFLESIFIIFSNQSQNQNQVLVPLWLLTAYIKNLKIYCKTRLKLFMKTFDQKTSKNAVSNIKFLGYLHMLCTFRDLS